MSLHFLIDGYNFIKNTRCLNYKGELRDARRALVSMIRNHRLLGSSKNSCTIVFDSKDNSPEGCSQNRGQIRVVFSKGESADELIKRIVQNDRNPSQIVVVTNDKEIVVFTRSLGAGVQSVDKFLAKQKKQPQQTNLQKIEEQNGLLKVNLSYTQQEAINRELRQIWS